jgi:hypothetical protein
MLTHLKNCHEEMKLEIMGEEEEEEEFGDPLGMVAIIRSKLTLSASVLGSRIRRFRIRNRIRRIRMFLGHPDPLVRGTDPAPDPSLFS